jgi:hypothetical protein
LVSILTPNASFASVIRKNHAAALLFVKIKQSTWGRSCPSS